MQLRWQHRIGLCVIGGSGAAMVVAAIWQAPAAGVSSTLCVVLAGAALVAVALWMGSELQANEPRDPPSAEGAFPVSRHEQSDDRGSTGQP